MKNIFRQDTIEELKSRIQKVQGKSQPFWGKMNAYQMLRHCQENESMMLREKKFERLLIGRVFGKVALKSNIKDNTPLKKNSPTHPALKIKGDGNIELEKKQWCALLDKYPTKQPSDYVDFIHPFFGKMNSEQVSRLAFKHIDHHLRQFGV